MKRSVLALLSAGFALSTISAHALEAGSTSEVIVADAKFPTNMAFAPDGRLFYNEKDTGDVRIVQGGELLPQPFTHLDVAAGGETGLLGLAIPYDFVRDPWVYIYLSDAKTGNNEVVRIRADGNIGGEVQSVLTALPTENGYHNGGDIAFGADNMLYVTVGEVHESDRAQDPSDLGGKILRITPEGRSFEGNPFGQTPVYSMGHRNSFGICFDPADGQLYETENGPDSNDEVNRIVAGGNYGWPAVMGPGGPDSFVQPFLYFPKVIVPTGCAVWNGDLYFGDMSGNVRRASLGEGPYGGDIVGTLPSGVTDLQVGPDGSLYIATTAEIVSWRSAPGTAPQGSPAPTLTASNHFETYAAWAAGAFALVLVILGGLWFRRLSRRQNATPDA